VLVFKPQIYKLKKQNFKYVFANIKNLSNYHNYLNRILIIRILQFDKLQVGIFKFTSLQLYGNYQITKITKITKLQIASAFSHIYKFANAKFSHFHTCMYYKIIKL